MDFHRCGFHFAKKIQAIADLEKTSILADLVPTLCYGNSNCLVWFELGILRNRFPAE